MNQCRSGKKLFRRKSVSKNLLPSKPVDIHIEPWWQIQTGFITDDDVKVHFSVLVQVMHCMLILNWHLFLGFS